MSMTDNSQSPLPPNAQITADELRMIQEHRARQAASQTQSPVVMHNPQIQFTLSAEDLDRIVKGVLDAMTEWRKEIFAQVHNLMPDE
jgi:Holliday junction resolvase RusA-like endonuclease